MAVSFERIPSNIRVPLFYAEVSNREASYLQQLQPALLIGPMLPAAMATPLEPVLVRDRDDAVGLFGPGAILTDMVDFYRRNDSYGSLWCIPQADPTTGTAMTTTLTVEGMATAPGNLAVYIGGDRYAVSAGMGDDHVAIATRLHAAINGDAFCMMSAAAPDVSDTDETVLVLSMKSRGMVGNELQIQLNVRGLAGGESTPLGVTVGMTRIVGTGLTDLAPAIAAMGDDEYDFIATPYTDAASLDLIRDALNDITGRWSWSRQIYGHAFHARMGDLNTLVTFGKTRNDPHTSILGFPTSPTVSWRRAAALCAQAATSMRIDPARPLQTLTMAGVLPSGRSAKFGINASNTLLYSGIATEQEAGGAVAIQRCVTTYQVNQWNQPDPSWLDVQTPLTLMFIIRFLRNRILSKFPRHKLANDGTPFGLGQAIVTPRIIRAELIAAYSEMIEMGICENMDAFKRFLVVERDPIDPNRVNVLLPPDLVNQLRIFAMLVEFRLRSATPSPALAAA